jgi:hypothetical protein
LLLLHDGEGNAREKTITVAHSPGLGLAMPHQDEQPVRRSEERRPSVFVQSRFAQGGPATTSDASTTLFPGRGELR